MRKAMATMMLLAGGLFAAPHVAVRFGVGIPAPVAIVRPACPGPGYAWVDGSYAPNGGWVAGYWAPPVLHVDRDYDRDRDHRVDRDRGFDRDHQRDEHFRR